MADVDLWVVQLSALQPRSRALTAVLSPRERDRAAGLKSAARHTEFTLTRGFVRTVLCGYVGAPAAELELSDAGQGKPVQVPTPGTVAIAFNVSHSKGAVALAICRSRAVGVDIERIRPMPNALAMAAQYFAADEHRRLAEQLEPTDRDALFLRFWTRKEALMKAHGGGLTLGTGAICVDFGPAPVGGIVRLIEGRTFAVTDCDVVPDCHVCVAAEGPAVSVTLREASGLLDRL
ncbi:MAG: 4'-phosphopantetheinyl transferase superfamily protein [Thalassobaculaceae bacterium]|nr:4'-phosphopantetheinyl transferase superfamily protein [Thalassobaculaceae bacterium]